MEPATASPPWRLATRALVVVFAPLLLSWTAGTHGALLDLAATPAAALASLPARFGLFGALAVGLLTAVSTRAPALRAPVQWFGGLAGLGLLASMAAGARPLPWAAAAVGLAWWSRPPSRRAGPAWSAPRGADLLLPPTLWLLCARARPWGEGLLPAALEDRAALALGGPWAWVGVVALIAVLATCLHTRSPGSLRGAAVGAGLMGLAITTFGEPSGWPASLALGALVGAWPPVARPGSLGGALVPGLLVCALGHAQLAAAERWRCDLLQDAPPQLTILRTGSDARSLGLSAGNLPYVGVIVGDGDRLVRMTVTGAVGEEVRLLPPGGALVSSSVAGQAPVRLVETRSGLRAEWWDLPRMSVTATLETGLHCTPRRALHWDQDDMVLVRCTSGDAWRLTPTAATASDDDDFDAVERLRRGELEHRAGAFAATQIRDAEARVMGRSALGPWASTVVTSPERFAVARGPAGHVALRGLPEEVPSLFEAPSAPAERVVAMLSGRRDTARVGTWPDQISSAIPQEALYVSSSLDARVTLVDPMVSWHQRAVLIGAPPRQLVAEPASGTVYAANRCGVFAVRIAGTVPWE